jgi:hypothetical protein
MSKKTRLQIGKFNIFKSDKGYEVFEKITDPEHPFYNHMDVRLSHLVFNYQTVNEIQENITELKNCNELVLLN